MYIENQENTKSCESTFVIPQNVTPNTDIKIEFLQFFNNHYFPTKTCQITTAAQGKFFNNHHHAKKNYQNTIATYHKFFLRFIISFDYLIKNKRFLFFKL